MGETQSKPTSTHLTIIKHTSIMHETLLECNENAMHKHIATISQNPTQENPKIFEKPQNLGLNCMNA